MKMLVVIFLAAALFFYGCTAPSAPAQNAQGEEMQRGVGEMNASPQMQNGQQGANARMGNEPPGPAGEIGHEPLPADAGVNMPLEGADRPAQPPEAGAEGGVVNASGVVKEITIEASNWEFEPSVINVSAGDTVKITLISKDVAHGIGIREFGFDLKVDAGQQAVGQFVASKKGTYAFHCNVFCGQGHREMAGTLVVS